MYICIVDPCQPGQYMVAAAACIPVPAGYYRPQIMFSGVLYVCPSNYYSNAGATSCTPCQANYYSNPGDSVCTGPCAMGTFISRGNCELVPAGKAAFESFVLGSCL